MKRKIYQLLKGMKDFKVNRSLSFILIVMLFFSISECKKDKSSSDTTVNSNLPVLSTSSVGSITPTTASSGGHITSQGGAAVVFRGICWNTNGSPTIQDNHTSDGEGTGYFYSDLSGLQQATSYSVRAYAVNTYGTAYGNEVKFTTPAWVQAPTVTTRFMTSVTMNSATGGGEVTDEGSTSVIARGICWSTGSTPTIQDNKTTESSGIGTFISQMTNLSVNTRYYVRAYATNSNAGAAYGNAVYFTTRGGSVTDLDGNVYYYTQIGTQTWMTENLKSTKYSDGSPIPEKEAISDWNSTLSGAYCIYYDSTPLVGVYGRLYNWYAAHDARNPCPSGWHVPVDDEWQTLMTFCGGDSIAGGKLKETGNIHWAGTNAGATNETGFTGLPGGQRAVYGLYYDFLTYGGFWSSTIVPLSYAHARSLYDSDPKCYLDDQFTPDFAVSIRCIKN